MNLRRKTIFYFSFKKAQVPRIVSSESNAEGPTDMPEKGRGDFGSFFIHSVFSFKGYEEFGASEYKPVMDVGATLEPFSFSNK